MQNSWNRSSEKYICGTLWYENIILTKKSIQTLGVYISHKKKIQDESNFSKTIQNLCNFTKLWRIRNVTLKGEMTTLKSLAFSKIVHLAIITYLILSVPNTVIEELKKIQKIFFVG